MKYKDDPEVFDAAFYELWFRGQDEKERERELLRTKRPTQIAPEFLPYLRLVSSIPDARVVEIGVAQGHQKRFYEELLECCCYVGIDRDPNPSVTLCGDSHDYELVEKASELLPGVSADILFIDGDHSYNGVRLDFDMWSELVCDDGFIGFHDIAREHPQPEYQGVRKFWLEIKERKERYEPEKVWEFYTRTSAAGFSDLPDGSRGPKQLGIGVVQV